MLLSSLFCYVRPETASLSPLPSLSVRNQGLPETNLASIIFIWWRHSMIYIFIYVLVTTTDKMTAKNWKAQLSDLGSTSGSAFVTANRCWGKSWPKGKDFRTEGWHQAAFYTQDIKTTRGRQRFIAVSISSHTRNRSLAGWDAFVM